jgi:hypothetical protein
MYRVLSCLVCSVAFLPISLALTPQTAPASLAPKDGQRITVDCQHCSDDTRTELNDIAKGIVQAESTSCFRKWFVDHPPTEVETRVSPPNVDVCSNTGVTVTPKATEQVIEEVRTADRNLVISLRITAL